MNIKFQPFLSLLSHVVMLSALALLSHVPRAFAENYTQWGLVQPVGWKNLDQRCTDAGNVSIDRVTANSRGGSALVRYYYPEDGWGCPKEAFQQFLYRWDFDRDVSVVTGNKGDTAFVTTLGIERATQPPVNCPSLNPFMSIGGNNVFASSIGGEARFYSDSSHNFHVPGPRVFRINNPLFAEDYIEVSLYGPGGVGRCIDLRIKYDFSSKVTGGSSSGSGLETLIIPNTEPKKVRTSFATQKGTRYTIEASGVVSDWGDKDDGVDPVWCYAEWRCGTMGLVWDQLRINDKGMTELAGKPIPYNSSHTYQIEFTGDGNPIEFYAVDALGSPGDNKGFFTVKVSMSGATSTADCLFNWAEDIYPQFFTPPIRQNNSVMGYTYRYYSATNNYLGTKDGGVYLYAPSVSDAINNVGTMAYYANLAGCR